MSDASNDSCDNKVGYKRPPVHTRFQKGYSGNPKGRPKGTKNFKTDLLEELSELVLITEGGKDTRISKQRAILKRTAQKALTGDTRSIGMLVSWIIQFLDETSESSESDVLRPDDKAILDQYILKKNNSNKVHAPDGEAT